MVGTNKAQLLSIIQRAKSAHLQWRAYAQGIAAGVPLEESKAPVKHTDCKFGQWYYSEGKAVLGHLDIFNNIAGPHEMLHLVYEQIYSLATKQKFAKANEKMNDLLSISRTLLESIALLENEVQNMQ